MTSYPIAQTIIEQMGGFGPLKVMVGAHTFLADENSVQFSFKGSRKANRCRVTYESGRDTYRFQLWHIPKYIRTIPEPIVDDTGVFCDMLQPMFEDATGLDLSMIRVVFVGGPVIADVPQL